MSCRRHPVAAPGIVAVILIAGCDGRPGAMPPAAPTAASHTTGVDDTPRIHFTDVTETSGIDMIWTSGVSPSTQIVEVKGGGVALIDYDGDGDLDVFVPNGATMDSPGAGPGCRLYRNDTGTGPLRFEDATADAGLAFSRWGIGVAVGDYDADGHDDLYVTCYGENALLRNTGDGRFEETTRIAGVGGEAWSAAAAFGDIDADGDLDLYVANYLAFDIAAPPPVSSFKNAPVFMGPRGLPPQQDVLYENRGDGTFDDITTAAGCTHPKPGFGLGVVILDFDGDGLQDIFVGNDSTPNFLYMNQGDGTFDERGISSGIALNIDGSDQSTMGIAIGDVTGNGFADVFTTNFSNDSNTLHISKAGRFFDDETRRFGVGMLSFPYVGWAAGFYDLDHDADEDLVLFNGHVYPNATLEVMDAEYAEPPLLYARERSRFVRVADDSAGPWLHAPHCDRGAAFGDLDDDGDIDVVVVELRGPVRVLRNDAVADAAQDDWLIVELDPPSLGSRIELRSGELAQTRWIHSGGSFASASARAAHFGLPEAADRLDLRITWPDGRVQEIEDVARGQRLIVAAQ